MFKTYLWVLSQNLSRVFVALIFYRKITNGFSYFNDISKSLIHIHWEYLFTSVFPKTNRQKQSWRHFNFWIDFWNKSSIYFFIFIFSCQIFFSNISSPNSWWIIYSFAVATIYEWFNIWNTFWIRFNLFMI